MVVNWGIIINIRGVRRVILVLSVGESHNKPNIDLCFIHCTPGGSFYNFLMFIALIIIIPRFTTNEITN